VKSSPNVVVDVAILGGGIAGLWLLDRLVHEGFSAVLFEADRLGAGQSVASQGIIHGGAKYTFGLRLDSAVKGLRAMPRAWRDALEGAHGPDLSRARTLSPRTFMWLPKQIGGGVLGAFSRLVMRSRVSALARADWPDGLRSESAAGAVYALDEIVCDVPSVLAALAGLHRARIRRIPNPEALSFSEAGGCLELGDLRVRAQRFVLTAGAGNEGLLANAGIDTIAGQRRPLHQVVVAGMKQALYAHCVGKSTQPLATVTAHPAPDGDFVWNVGGGLAEDGVGDSPEALVRRAKQVLPRLFPAADFGSARFASFRIDRAEGAMTGGRRPGGPMVETCGPITVAWPTKLALAPALAGRVIEGLTRDGVRPAEAEIDALASLAEPSVARPPWEAITAWN